MNPKKSAVFFLICAASFQLFALEYFVGVTTPNDSSEMHDKLSSCKFYSHGEFRTDPLPGKPSPTDDVYFHWGKYNFEIDTDLTVNKITVGDNCETILKKHLLRTKSNLHINISTIPDDRTLFSADNGTLDIGGELYFHFWPHAKNAGGALFELSNSKAAVKGGLSCVIPVNPSVVQISDRCLVIVSLKGKSILTFNGGSVIDDIFRDSPDDWGFRFRFSEADGNMPLVAFQKRTNFDGCDIEVNFSKSIKVGKYPLMDFNDKRSDVAKARNVIMNGKKISFGESVDVGDGKTAVLEIAPNPKGRDTRTKNDLVLTVK